MSQEKKLTHPADLKNTIELFERVLKFPNSPEDMSEVRLVNDETLWKVAQYLRPEDNYTLLYEAVKWYTCPAKQRLEVIEKLLHHGADKFIDIYHRTKTNTYETSLILSAITEWPTKKVPTLTTLLLKKTKHPADLFRAAVDLEESTLFIGWLLSTFPDLKKAINAPSEKNRPAPLLKAARKRNHAVFEQLMSLEGTDSQIKTLEGNNIFHECLLGMNDQAITAADRDFLSFLKEHSFFIPLITQQNTQGLTPFRLACNLENIELIDLLYSHLAKQPITLASELKAAIHDAIGCGKIPMLNKLFELTGGAERLLEGDNPNESYPYEAALQAEHSYVTQGRYRDSPGFDGKSFAQNHVLMQEKLIGILFTGAPSSRKAAASSNKADVWNTRFSQAQKSISTGDIQLDTVMSSMLEQLKADFNSNRQQKTPNDCHGTPNENVLNKILGLAYGLEQLGKAFSSAKTPEEKAQAKNTFIEYCSHKLYSDEITSRYKALLGVIIGLIFATLIATTLLLFATGGLAAFATTTTLAFLTTEAVAIICTSAALGAIVGGTIGYTRGEAAQWRADFFAVGRKIDENIEDSYPVSDFEEDSTPLLEVS
jgi:hypothetical protein